MKQIQEAYIVAATRTPIGRSHRGVFRNMRPDDLLVKALQAALAQGQIPAYEMIEGPILLVGGALLLTPGFFSDCLGFACLIPPLRRKIAQYIIEHHLLNSQAGSVFKQAQSNQTIIEGEYKKQD